MCYNKNKNVWNVSEKETKKEIELKEFTFQPVNNYYMCPLEYKFEGQELPYKKAVDFSFFNGRDLIKNQERYTARSSFVIKGYKGRLQLFTEVDCAKKLMLNGKALKLENNYRLWGPKNCLIDISEIAKEGRNEIVLEGVVPNYFSGVHGIPNTILFGDFALDEEKRLIAFDGKIGERYTFAAQNQVLRLIAKNKKLLRVKRCRFS